MYNYIIISLATIPISIWKKKGFCFSLEKEAERERDNNTNATSLYHMT